MQVLGRITDLAMLNIVYLITCLPVVTVGVATTALYRVCFRMLRQDMLSPGSASSITAFPRC